MNDSFDEKRGMVKKLLDMLKDHASNEVSNGLAKPEGEGDMHGLKVEKVEVLPGHEMDEPTPEHDVDTHEMHTGGIVDKISPVVDPPMESEAGHPDKEGAAHKEDVVPLEARESAIPEEEQEPHDREYEEATSEPTSMFASFLGKKKRK